MLLYPISHGGGAQCARSFLKQRILQIFNRQLPILCAYNSRERSMVILVPFGGRANLRLSSYGKPKYHIHFLQKPQMATSGLVWP